ncbi:hypothetical protein ES708_26801 [subsurface metagenome]
MVDMVCAVVSDGLLGKGPAAHLPEKSSSSRACTGSMTWYKQVRQPELALYCLLKLVYAEGQRRKWHQPHPLRVACAYCSQESPPRRVNNLSLCFPGGFQISVFMLSVSRLFACPKQHSALWALSQSSLLTFITPHFRLVLW